MRGIPVRPAVTGAAVALLAAVAVGLPVGDLGGQVPRDVGDPLLNVWALAWESSALVRAPGDLYQGNTFWPEPASIAYSESMLPLVPVFGLLRVVFGGPVAAHSVLVWLLVVGAVAGCWALARRYVRRPVAALLAGLSYGLGGYAMAHTAQVQLLTLGSIPVVFLLWFRAMERRSVPAAAGCGAAVAVASLASLYYGVALAASLVVLAVAQLVADRRALPAVATVAAAAAALTLPGLLVYLDVDERLGLDRPPEPTLELELDDFVSAPQQTLLYVDLAHRALGRPAATEHVLFPGFVVLGLAAAGVVVLVRQGHTRRRELAGLGAVGVVSVVLALGHESGGVDLPFGWLHEHVPGFGGIRATARLAVPALVLLAVLAAVALDRLLARLDGRAARVVGAAAVVVLVVELWAPVPWHPVQQGDDVVAVYEALDDRPPGPVVELPMGDPRAAFGSDTVTWAFAEPNRMLHSLVDGNPRVNGFSGFLPDRYLEVVDRMASFPSPDSLNLVEELGVRYVVLHTGRASDGAGQFTAAEVRRIVRALPDGWSAGRHGRSWLLERPCPRRSCGAGGGEAAPAWGQPRNPGDDPGDLGNSP